VPTLRNVATRQVFFHNGAFKSLLDALRFYVRRDTNPEQFYPLDADGVVDKFDDLPAELHRNVNTEEVPYERHPGQAPRLDDAEIDDVIAFLGTLTDGYDPATDTADPARSIAPTDIAPTNLFEFVLETLLMRNLPLCATALSIALTAAMPAHAEDE